MDRLQIGPVHVGLAEHCRLQHARDGSAALWLYASDTLDGDRPVLGVALLSREALGELKRALNDQTTP